MEQSIEERVMRNLARLTSPMTGISRAETNVTLTGANFIRERDDKNEVIARQVSIYIGHDDEGLITEIIGSGIIPKGHVVDIDYSRLEQSLPLNTGEKWKTQVRETIARPRYSKTTPEETKQVLNESFRLYNLLNAERTIIVVRAEYSEARGGILSRLFKKK